MQERDIPVRGENVKGRGRVKTFGLDSVDFAERIGRPGFISGPQLSRRMEREYQGGASAADRTDRFNA